MNDELLAYDIIGYDELCRESKKIQNFSKNQNLEKRILNLKTSN